MATTPPTRPLPASILALGLFLNAVQQGLGQRTHQGGPNAARKARDGLSFLATHLMIPFTTSELKLPATTHALSKATKVRNSPLILIYLVILRQLATGACE